MMNPKMMGMLLGKIAKMEKRITSIEDLIQQKSDILDQKHQERVEYLLKLIDEKKLNDIENIPEAPK